MYSRVRDAHEGLNTAVNSIQDTIGGFSTDYHAVSGPHLRDGSQILALFANSPCRSPSIRLRTTACALRPLHAVAPHQARTNVAPLGISCARIHCAFGGGLKNEKGRSSPELIAAKFASFIVEVHNKARSPAGVKLNNLRDLTNAIIAPSVH